MRTCEECYYCKGGCDYWMTVKRACSRFVAWSEVIAYLGGKVSLKPI